MSSDEAFLERLVRALADCRLDAVIVGMTAAVLQGAPVMTQDVDLLIRDTAANRKKLKALQRLLGGLESVKASELAPIETLIGADVPIDVVFDRLPGGLPFASVKARSVGVRIGVAVAVVASIEDVIKSKKAANRPKDLAALPILEATAKALKVSKT